MAYKEDEQTLAADIPLDLYTSFNTQKAERGYVKKQAIAAAIRLWLSLPEHIQARLLNKTLHEEDFIELIHQIVDDYINAGQKAASR